MLEIITLSNSLDSPDLWIYYDKEISKFCNHYDEFDIYDYLCRVDEFMSEQPEDTFINHENLVRALRDYFKHN